MSNIEPFKGKAPVGAFAALNPQAESLADGIGSSYGIIHYKGKTWTLALRGENYTFVRSDDGSPLAFLDVIILRQLPTKSKTFYPKGSWERGESGPPLCSSLDGVQPDAGVKEQQANACAICPRNEWKTSPDGRKGRDCSDNKRLAVLVLPNLTKALLGAALMEPVFLRVPAASLNALARMGEDMAAQGWHYSSFITRIGFEMSAEFPKMTFTPLQGLTEKEAPIVLPMREDPQALRITGESELSKPRPVTQQIAIEPATQQVVKPSVAPQDKTEEWDMRGRPAATSLPKNNLVIDVEPNKPEAIDTGFGSLDEPAKVIAFKQVTQTAADTGDVEDADDALNDRIANLLKTS
jgi:hypothetical protein